VVRHLHGSAYYTRAGALLSRENAVSVSNASAGVPAPDLGRHGLVWLRDTLLPIYNKVPGRCRGLKAHRERQIDKEKYLKKLR
ncbi:MAG TPA: hypothetical protein H9810_03745, partial [Candidatus Gemmiger excrementavium]|nr:hypothetical protein [Candidatus Gemmiger excrementavium]